MRCTSRWTPGRMTVPHLPPRGQHRCLRCCRRHGYSSAPWSRLSTLCRWSQCSMCLRRRWWNNWWTFLHLSISVLPSRLSKYPRSYVHPALLAQSSVRRRRQTSWWKCRRLSPILRYCSGLWSRSLTFQFLLVMEGETQIFKVFSEDRVQQRILRFWNAFLSRLWSRSLTFPLLVEVLQIFAQDRVHPQLRTLQLLGLTLRMSRFNGFFALFPRKKKVQMSPGTWVRECPGTSAHPRRQLMARALGLTTTRVRYGRCSRTRRSARGGTARGRVAPSGTRRGSAEPGCAGAVDVPVLMQRRGCLQFFDLVDMPVIVHRHVRSLCGDVVATSVVAQRQIPMVRSCVSPCSTLTRWSSYCTCKAVEDSRAPTVAALTKSLTCPVFNDSLWFNGQKTAEVPQLLRVALVAYVPVVQVVWCRFLRLWTPCDHAATSFSSTVEVPLTRSSQSYGHSSCTTEKGSTSRRSGYDGDEWFFGAFCAIFRAPPVIPELSASFSSPRR